MKCLERNKKVFYYSNYIEKKEIIDEWGNSTGQYELIRTEPIKAKGNISGARGESLTRQFGESLNYDKLIVMDKPNFDISEYSVLWIDKSPFDNEASHDYEVSQIARSLNSISIAVRKVDVRD